MHILDKADQKLINIYNILKKNPRRELTTGLIVYTVIFMIISFGTHFKIIRETGTILGGDGVTQYYPLLCDFRRNVQDFFTSVKEGHPSIRMMNFNFMFGSDTITTSALAFIQMLPVYVFSAFVPESSLALFFACVIIFISYLSGISNIIMCRYFKADSICSGLFAAAYVFNGNYFYTAMMNPSFIYMMILFPLLVTGLDKVLNDRNPVLFIICTAITGCTGPVALIYIFPFLVLFAATRVYFLKRKTFFPSLIKYFIRCSLLTVLSIGIAAFGFLPYMYILLNSKRNAGELPDLLSLFIPSQKYLFSVFDTYCIDNAAGISIITVPAIIFCAVSRKSKKEHTFLVIFASYIFSLPLMWYGLNGFMYDLCRWGFIPSCLFTFFSAFYLPHIFNLSKKSSVHFALLFLIYLISLPLKAGFIWLIFLTVSALLTHSENIRIIFSKLISNFQFSDRFSHLKLLKKCLHFTAIISLSILITALFICADYFRISVFSVLTFTIVILILSLIWILPKKHINNAVYSLFSVSLVSIFIFSTLADERVFNCAQSVSIIPNLSHVSNYHFDNNTFNRFASVDDEYARFTNNTSADINTGSIIQNSEDKNEDLTSADIALIYNFASNIIFFSIIDKDFTGFLERCGMDSNSISTVVDSYGYSNKEVIYSLLGINHMYTKHNTTDIYGTEKDPSLSDDSNNFFINRYALPAGVTYDNYVDEQTFNAFNSAELPYAMMNSVYLKNSDLKVRRFKNKYSEKCTFETDKAYCKTSLMGIDIYNTRFELDEPVSGGFAYINFSGVDYRTTPGSIAGNFSIKINDSKQKFYSISNNNTNWPWKLTKDHYSLSLGYIKEPLKEISFLSIFEYQNAEIIFIPEKIYTEGFSKITRETLENVKTDVNTLTGNITVSSDKVLCINLIHNDGWKAYVDGIKTPVYKANDLFLGIPLKEGSHDIKLVYRTPWLYEGIIISLIFICILMFIIYRYKTLRKLNYAQIYQGDYI